MRRAAAPFFLDNVHVLALANTRDQWHDVAMGWAAWLRRGRHRLLTTEFIPTEIADGLSAVRVRRRAVRSIEPLLADPSVEIVPASSDPFAAALALYWARTDQGWALTDCSSFVVMRERGLLAAPTADAHFRQAGFRALLLEEVPQ